MCTGSKIEWVSLAVPAAGPGFAERCVAPRLPEDVDLVILDFGINDVQSADRLSHPERQSYERILRRALAMPRSPAVLLFEAYAPFHAKNVFVGKQKDARGDGLSQGLHTLIAEYYGEVQALSVRAALWQPVVSAGDEDSMLIYLGKRFGGDFIHVSPYGHRWYADVLISFVRDAAVDVLGRRALARAANGQLPEHALDALLSRARTEGEGKCWGGGSASSGGSCVVPGSMGTDYPVHAAPNGLKMPFFQDNEVEDSGVCALGAEFASLVVSHEGWEWVDEGQAGRPKWGFVTEAINVKLVINVDVSGHKLSTQKINDDVVSGMPGSRLRSRDITANLIYLSSWRNIGTARVMCSGACMCDATVINGHATAYKASVPALHVFKMVPQESSEACSVTVQTRTETFSNGHRFKVMGLTTSTHQLFRLDLAVRHGDDNRA